MLYVVWKFFDLFIMRKFVKSLQKSILKITKVQNFSENEENLKTIP